MPHKILVVEDEPNILIPIRFLLEKNGYEVMAVENGEAVMEALSTFAPDLVLLDIMLPQMDGFEVCQVIRNHPDWREVKIVFLTAMGRDMDISKGMSMGGDAYITKPFSNAEVIECVKDLLSDEPQK
ncbi:MAG: response regulator transcription factor [Thermodesulfobacteriota bacterium]